MGTPQENPQTRAERAAELQDEADTLAGVGRDPTLGLTVAPTRAKVADSLTASAGPDIVTDTRTTEQKLDDAQQGLPRKVRES